MRPHEINEFKRTAYQRYKYGNLLGLKASDEKSMQSLDVIYIKLNALFGQLKDLTFNPVNVITALEELRSEKGLTPFKNFTDEQVLEYLTSEEKNEYQKLKSISENKKVTTALKKANDAKNIIIPEIDDKDLVFELTLEKTDNFLHALQTNGVNIPSLSNKNYELRVAYDIEKDDFSYIIYDTKSKTASFKNEFTNFIKSNTDLSNTIEEGFKFTIVKAFQEVNDLIIANPELDCEPWSFDDFESLIEDYKKIIYAERESDNDLRSLIADTTDLINRTTSLQEELKDLKMNMDNDAVEMEW